ncbi:hypothetical protein AVEN_219224-1 [Araneus ventricosus]|uniref:Uncharacterized protein n=1 Tax=Araneus ventricosus TaxID=182803 RepID=A0A4Y2VH93_ARAVE|nr:hypothetical protein AVEN_219224-1 [Araneus ventricosus]
MFMSGDLVTNAAPKVRRMLWEPLQRLLTCGVKHCPAGIGPNLHWNAQYINGWKDRLCWPTNLSLIEICSGLRKCCTANCLRFSAVIDGPILSRPFLVPPMSWRFDVLPWTPDIPVSPEMVICYPNFTLPWDAVPSLVRRL